MNEPECRAFIDVFNHLARVIFGALYSAQIGRNANIFSKLSSCSEHVLRTDRKHGKL